ncbi:MAG: hypothetical protein OEZ47_17105 [Gammaproteobacteria bacterium]|nr:hypothetical protein [Gammaproteobacteria bacterium]
MQAKVFFAIYMIAMVIGAGVCLYISAYTRESLTFVYCEFHELTNDYRIIGCSVQNLGNTIMEIVDLRVNSVSTVPPNYGSVDVVFAGETASLGFEYNWSTGLEYTITLVTARGNRFSHTEIAVSSETLLEIESVSWNSEANTTSIVVRNTGVRTHEITGLLIFKQPNWILPLTDYTDLDGGKSLPINQTITVTLNWPNAFASSWKNGETYRFYIGAETGGSKKFNSTAPF